MQVMIGETMAEMSDDGHDISFPAPAVAGRALVLPFRDSSRVGKPALAASVVAPTPQSNAAAPTFDLDGHAAAALVLCAVVAAIAASRFVNRVTAGPVPRRLDAELDDAAFLKRYARTS